MTTGLPRPMRDFSLSEKESQSARRHSGAPSRCYASRPIADVIPGVLDRLADRSLVRAPLDRDLPGFQVDNGAFDRGHGFDGLGDGLSAVAAGHTLDFE